MPTKGSVYFNHMSMTITHLNPESMHSNPAFSQAVMVSGAARTLYIGGQNGVDANGKIVGNDVVLQTEQALQNLLEILQSVKATQQNVVKMTVYLAHGQDVNTAFGAAQKVWGAQPTAITVVFVAALGLPGALVEIDAVAALA
jgi:2-iminobutanoate/2-iminopropanoate deaminase